MFNPKVGTITIAAGERGSDYEIMSKSDMAVIQENKPGETAGIGDKKTNGDTSRGSLESRVERLEKWMESFKSR